MNLGPVCPRTTQMLPTRLNDRSLETGFVKLIRLGMDGT
jgi:hypothetical protein